MFVVHYLTNFTGCSPDCFRPGKPTLLKTHSELFNTSRICWIFTFIFTFTFFSTFLHLHLLKILFFFSCNKKEMQFLNSHLLATATQTCRGFKVHHFVTLLFQEIEICQSALRKWMTSTLVTSSLSSTFEFSNPLLPHAVRRGPLVSP